MKNLVAQKWIDECGTLFPIDGNTVLYPTPGSGIFELYQGCLLYTSPSPRDRG